MDDVMYLLQEIGKDCKSTMFLSAIINNLNDENDSKRIITNEELRRGYYVEYNDLFFLIIDDVVDSRYKTYYKARMRKCNYGIKLIIGGKLYQFPAIAEGNKFAIGEDKR